jgi:hypothetical protein
MDGITHFIYELGKSNDELSNSNIERINKKGRPKNIP